MTEDVKELVAHWVKMARDSHHSNLKLRNTLDTGAAYDRGVRDGFLVAARALKKRFGTIGWGLCPGCGRPRAAQICQGCCDAYHNSWSS